MRLFILFLVLSCSKPVPEKIVLVPKCDIDKKIKEVDDFLKHDKIIKSLPLQDFVFFNYNLGKKLFVKQKLLTKNTIRCLL